MKVVDNSGRKTWQIERPGEIYQNWVTSDHTGRINKSYLCLGLYFDFIFVYVTSSYKTNFILARIHQF